MEKIIGTVLSLVGAVGTLIFILKLLPAFMFGLHGDYVNATDVIIDASVEEIISEVYWVLVVAIVSPIVGIFVYLFRR
jgi:hypothetical protein